MNVGAAQSTGSRAKGEEGKMGAPATKETDPKAAREKALEEAQEYGIIGLLNSGATDGVWGGVLGGTGSSSGSGGLGLSGVGIGGGGSGIGLGSIGTIGRGGGGGFGAGSSAVNPVAGQAVHVSGGTRIELGDSVTLGVTLEAGTRALRDRVYALRDCYRKALDRDKQLAGSVALRLVVGSEGRVELARELGSDLADRDAVACVLKALDDVYVGRPNGTFFGVVETVVSFSPAK